MSLELWSNGEDEVRLAAYMALRKLGASSDTSMLDMVLKVNREPEFTGFTVSYGRL